MLSTRRLLRAPFLGWHGGSVFPSTGNTGATLPALFTISGATTSSSAGGANTGWSYSGTSWTIGANAVLSGLGISGGIDIFTSGVRIQNCSISGGGGGELTIHGGVSNTTITNCLLTDSSGGGNSATVVTLGPSGTVTTNTTFSDCTIRGGDASANRIARGIADIFPGLAVGLVVQRCNIYWYKQALSIASGLIQDTYIHDPGFWTGDHTECAVFDGIPNGAALKFEHCTLWNNLDQTAAIDSSTLSGANFTPPNQHLTVDNCLLASGGYALYCGNLSSTTGSPPARNWMITDTGCAISGGTTLTDAALDSGLDNGATVTGTGIPAGTTIVPGSISGSTATLSQACTNGSGLAVTFHYTNNIVITNNRFSNTFIGAGGFGYTRDFDTAVASNIFAGNVVYETGAPVSPNT